MFPRNGSSESPPAPRKIWLLGFLGFFLVMGSWSIAGPVNGTVDESAHLIRAAGAASGEFIGAPDDTGIGAYQTVPTEYHINNCWVRHLYLPVDCTPPMTPGPTAYINTAAGRYFPLYYVVVGWPLNLFGGMPGLILARLISAALSAAFLASAFTVLARWSRYGLMLAGLVVVSSPMVVELGGFINPNGLEISAGIAFCASMIPLLLSPRRGSLTPLVCLASISGSILATAKAPGPLWVAVIAFALLLPLRSPRIRELLRQRQIWLGLLGLAGAIAVSAMRTLGVKATKIIPIDGTPKNLSISQAAQHELDRWVHWDGGYMHQIVGLMSWLDTRFFEPAYPVWWFCAGTLIIAAFAFGARLDRLRLATMIAGAVGVPFALQVAQANTLGYVTQARYFMAMLAAVPLLAAFTLERRGLDAAKSRSLTRLIAGLLLPVHFLALLYTMARWQHGVPEYPGVRYLNPLGGVWHPQSGSGLPLVAMAAGLSIVGVLVWKASARAAGIADEPGEIAVPVQSFPAESSPPQISTDAKTA